MNISGPRKYNVVVWYTGIASIGQSENRMDTSLLATSELSEQFLVYLSGSIQILAGSMYILYKNLRALQIKMTISVHNYFKNVYQLWIF